MGHDISALSYALVTPARNERDNLQRLADSIIAQDHPPTWWIIVDVGSDDDMDALADELARGHMWIVVTGTGERRADLAKGRRRGRDLLAFRRGLSVLPDLVDVFVTVDADTSFDPDYFVRLLDHFETQPDLGIAGGSCYELIDGDWQRIKTSGSHPRGASRAYRWALLDDVFALEPELGWDGRRRGYGGAARLPNCRFRGRRLPASPEDRRTRRTPESGDRGGTPGVVHGLPTQLSHAARALPGAGECHLACDTRGQPSAALRSAPTRRSPTESVKDSGYVS